MRWFAWSLSTAFMVISLAAFLAWFDPSPWEYGLVTLALSVVTAVLGVVFDERRRA